MTTKEMVIEILKHHSCQTAFQIKGCIYRKFNENVTPQAVSRVMRPLVAKGYAGKGTHPESNKSVYWLSDFGKETLEKKGDLN